MGHTDPGPHPDWCRCRAQKLQECTAPGHQGCPRSPSQPSLPGPHCQAGGEPRRCPMKGRADSTLDLCPEGFRPALSRSHARSCPLAWSLALVPGPPLPPPSMCPWPSTPPTSMVLSAPDLQTRRHGRRGRVKKLQKQCRVPFTVCPMVMSHQRAPGRSRRCPGNIVPTLSSVCESRCVRVCTCGHCTGVYACLHVHKYGFM